MKKKTPSWSKSHLSTEIRNCWQKIEMLHVAVYQLARGNLTQSAPQVNLPRETYQESNKIKLRYLLRNMIIHSSIATKNKMAVLAPKYITMAVYRAKTNKDKC